MKRRHREALARDCVLVGTTGRRLAWSFVESLLEEASVAEAELWHGDDGRISEQGGTVITKSHRRMKECTIGHNWL